MTLMTLLIHTGWPAAVDYISQYPGSGMFYSLADYYPAASVGRYRTTKGTPSELRDLVQSGYLLALCHSTAILNVERTRAVGGYRFDLYVEDIDLWWRMALHYDIRFIPEVLTGYRQNQQGLSSLNLEEQTLSGFYVQYLLISHLWKRNPLAYEEARSSLLRLFNSRKVNFRNHLRAFNMGLGRGDKNAAFVHAARAVFASPTNFMRRLWDEYSPRRAITLGEPPMLFKKHESILWPNRAGNQREAALCPNPMTTP